MTKPYRYSSSSSSEKALYPDISPFTENPFNAPPLKEQQQALVFATLCVPSSSKTPYLVGRDRYYGFGRHFQLANGNPLKVLPSDFICSSHARVHSIRNGDIIWDGSERQFPVELPAPLFSQAIENKVKFTDDTVKFSKQLRFSCAYGEKTAEFVIKIPDKCAYTLRQSRRQPSNNEHTLSLPTSMRILKTIIDGSEDFSTFRNKIQGLSLDINYNESTIDSHFTKAFEKIESQKDSSHRRYKKGDQPEGSFRFLPKEILGEGAVFLTPQAKRIKIGEWGWQPVDPETLEVPSEDIEIASDGVYTDQFPYDESISLCLLKLECVSNGFEIIFDEDVLYILSKSSPGIKDKIYGIPIPGLQKDILDGSFASAHYDPLGSLYVWVPVATQSPQETVAVDLDLDLDSDSEEENFGQILTGRKTMIVAHCNAGFGNRLTIRGDMNHWENGFKMKCIDNDLWIHQFEHIPGEEAAFKILLNDTAWEITHEGKDRILHNGDQIEITPIFGDVVDLNGQMNPSSSSSSAEEIPLIEEPTLPDTTAFFESLKKELSTEKIAAILQAEGILSFPKTRIVVHCDAGYGNFIAIRGSTFPLTWDEGVKMESIGPNLWTWECDQFNSDITCKFLLNDEKWESDVDHTFKPGGESEFTPTF